MQCLMKQIPANSTISFLMNISWQRRASMMSRSQSKPNTKTATQSTYISSEVMKDPRLHIVSIEWIITASVVEIRSLLIWKKRRLALIKIRSQVSLSSSYSKLKTVRREVKDLYLEGCRRSRMRVIDPESTRSTITIVCMRSLGLTPTLYKAFHLRRTCNFRT